MSTLLIIALIASVLLIIKKEVKQNESNIEL